MQEALVGLNTYSYHNTYRVKENRYQVIDANIIYLKMLFGEMYFDKNACLTKSIYVKIAK